MVTEPVPAGSRSVTDAAVVGGVGRRVGVSVVAGLLLAFSLPPWSVWPAAIAGVALLVAVLVDAPWWQRGLFGWIAGCVWFGTTLWWVAAFTGPGAVVLVAVQAMFPGAAALVTPPGRGRLPALPGALVVMEALRQSWPLGGLPLSSLALGQVSGPLRSLASIVGPLGLVMVAAGIASLVVVLLGMPRTRGAVIAAAVALTVTLTPHLVPSAPGTQTAGTPIEVAVAQGGGPRGVSSVNAQAGEQQRVFQRHLVVAASADVGVDLLLWPEDTVDVEGRFATSDEYVQLAELAADLDASVVVGVVEDADDVRSGIRRFRNAAVVIGPDGEIVGRYDKVQRVPFGEYVPWRSLLERFVDLSLIPRDAVPGTGVGLVTTPVGDLGVAISFEGLFASRSRDAVRAGAALILLPTNSSSYASDDVPAQQVAAARLRAIETGRTVVMAAPTGYSAIVDPDGRVRRRSELGQASLLRSTVEPRRGLTPYARFGDGPVVLLALVMIVGAHRWRRR